MQNRMEHQVNAGFFVRLTAYLIDCLIVGAALFFVRLPITISAWSNPEGFLVKDFIFQYSIADIAFYLLQVSYFILLTYHTGATIGKKLLHLRVVSVEDRKLTFFEVAFRETVGRFLSALVIYVGYFMIGIHKEKLGLHDMLSDTAVIYYHEKKVAVEPPVVEKKEVSERAYAPYGYSLPVYTEEIIQPKAEENAEMQPAAEGECIQKEPEQEGFVQEESVQEIMQEENLQEETKVDREELFL